MNIGKTEILFHKGFKQAPKPDSQTPNTTINNKENGQPPQYSKIITAGLVHRPQPQPMENSTHNWQERSQASKTAHAWKMHGNVG